MKTLSLVCLLTLSALPAHARSQNLSCVWTPKGIFKVDGNPVGCAGQSICSPAAAVGHSEFTRKKAEFCPMDKCAQPIRFESEQPDFCAAYAEVINSVDEGRVSYGKFRVISTGLEIYNVGKKDYSFAFCLSKPSSLKECEKDKRVTTARVVGDSTLKP